MILWKCDVCSKVADSPTSLAQWRIMPKHWRRRAGFVKKGSERYEVDVHVCSESCAKAYDRLEIESGEAFSWWRSEETADQVFPLKSTSAAASVNVRVAKESERFHKALPKLMKSRAMRGKAVVFLGGRVRSTHDTMEQAYASALNEFGIDGGYVIGVVDQFNVPRVVDVSGMRDRARRRARGAGS